VTPYSDFVTLPNRRRIRIRYLRRREERPIRELDAGLSRQTRYLRFFSAMSELPDSLVSRLAAVDCRRHVALVAESASADTRTIALGSFGAIDDESAEVALVVCDDWQGQRLGTELARRVLDAAEARGFHRFVANVLSDNIPIRRIVENLGEIVAAKWSGNSYELAFVRRGAGDARL